MLAIARRCVTVFALTAIGVAVPVAENGRDLTKAARESEGVPAQALVN